MEHHHLHPPAAIKQRTAHDLPIQPSPLRPTAMTSQKATSHQTTPKRSNVTPSALKAQTTSMVPKLEEEELESSDSSDTEEEKKNRT